MATAARPVPASRLSFAARKEKLLGDKGVTPPLPARYEQTTDGIKLRVRAPDALTKDWRINHGAAPPGSTTTDGETKYDAKAYFVPKAVIERTPDEKLSSEQIAPE